MIEQIDWLVVGIGISGFFFLVVVGVVIMFSSEWSSFFTKTFFIEPVSDKEKKKVKEFAEKDLQKKTTRFFIGGILIFYGLGAIIWTQGFDIFNAFLLITIVGIIFYRYKIWLDNKKSKKQNEKI